MAAAAASEGWTVVSDTSIGDGDEVPRLIMLGYTRIFDEAETAWGTVPDIIFVPAGVGGLLAAAASWLDWRFGPKRPKLVAVEPLTAACVQTSAREGRPTTLAGPFDTVMAGLRCGEVSTAAFPTVLTLVDSYVAIEDEWSFRAMRHLARPLGDDPAVEAGASGAAALGGLLATLGHGSLADLASRLGLRRPSRVVAIATEGVTDPELFARVV
jgi:diaminopropionate ammonia-lyase